MSAANAGILASFRFVDAAAEAIRKLKEQGIVPGLGVILVGEDPASKSYVTAQGLWIFATDRFADGANQVASGAMSSVSQADLSRGDRTMGSGRASNRALAARLATCTAAVSCAWDVCRA